MIDKLYDLEAQIQECWRVTDDIHLVWTEFSDSEETMSEDELCNIMLGLEALYNRKFTKLFRTLEACMQLRHKQKALKENKVDTSALETGDAE